MGITKRWTFNRGDEQALYVCLMGHCCASFNPSHIEMLKNASSPDCPLLSVEDDPGIICIEWYSVIGGEETKQQIQLQLALYDNMEVSKTNII